MSRMLAALKQLESRGQTAETAAPPTSLHVTAIPSPIGAAPTAVNLLPTFESANDAGEAIEARMDELETLLEAAEITAELPPAAKQIEIASSAIEPISSPTPPAGSLPAAAAAFDLPRFRTADQPRVALRLQHEQLAAYTTMAARILADSPRRPLAVLLTTAEPLADDWFSLSTLAVAAVTCCSTDVLLVQANPAARLGAMSETAISAPGMFEVAAGQTDWDQVARQTNLPNVQMMPIASTAPPRLKRQSWELFKQRAGCTLIYAAVGAPAVERLAPVCDATYLLLELHCARRTATLRALDTLRAAGANVAGCIVLGDAPNVLATAPHSPQKS